MEIEFQTVDGSITGSRKRLAADWLADLPGYALLGVAGDRLSVLDAFEHEMCVSTGPGWPAPPERIELAPLVRRRLRMAGVLED